MAHGVDEVWNEGATSPKVKQCSEKKGHVKTVREGKGVGSRRIFSPQFKLQVLDSYRKDSDCRGNQRATARKYGIHRRQIQKWLQMETTLRCNVEVGSELALNLARQRDGSQPPVAGCLPTPAQDPEPQFIDVDKVSDSEDDLSSDTSLYDQEQALDFTCAALSKRRFFSVSFKLEVLDAFYNDPACRGNQRATARKFGIHRRQVQKWLDNETQLRSEPSEPECSECLDLSKKRKLETLTPLPVEDERMSQVPVSQEEALCLVKPTAVEPPPTPDLYRPYNLSSSPPARTTSPPYDPCHWSTPYYPYYGMAHTSYLSPWIPPSPDVHYYKQPLHCLNIYTPMYSS